MASSVETPMQGSSLAQASPLAALMPMRSPVKEPGPTATAHGVHVGDAEFTILQHGFSHGQQGAAVGQAGVLKAAGQKFSILHQGDRGGFCRGFQS